MTTLITLPHTGLQVPHTHLHVTSLKEFETSRGVAFTATLRLRTTIVGKIEDAGVGGGPRFEPKDRNKFGHTEMDAFAAQCIIPWDGPSHTEFVLGDLVEEYATQREVDREHKKGNFVCRRMQPITTGVTDMIQRDTLAFTGALPTTSTQRIALGSRCADHVGRVPGDLWQAWDPNQNRWLDLLTVTDQS